MSFRVKYRLMPSRDFPELLPSRSLNPWPTQVILILLKGTVEKQLPRWQNKTLRQTKQRLHPLYHRNVSYLLENAENPQRKDKHPLQSLHQSQRLLRRNPHALSQLQRRFRPNMTNEKLCQKPSQHDVVQLLPPKKAFPRRSPTANLYQPHVSRSR